MNASNKRIWRRSKWRINPVVLLWMIAIGRSDDAAENISSIAIVNTARQSVETRTVTIDCNPDHMCVHVPIEFDRIQLPDCFERKDQQFCTTDLSGCGTNFNVLNDTHVLYSNQVPYGENSLITWKCLYPVETITNLNISTERAQMKEIGIIAQAPVGAGRFYVSFQLFSDDAYKYPFGFRPQLPRDGVIRGRVTLHNHTSLGRATVQLTRCWATPTADPSEGFDLIDNFCPVKSGAEVQLLNSGTDHYATFESGVFKFTKSANVYLHCHVRICFRNNQESENCAIQVDQCPSNRIRRGSSLEPNPDTTITIGPIDVQDAVVIEDLERQGAYDARENFSDNFSEIDNKIKIEPALLWSLLIALMVAAVGLGAILVYWLKEDHKQSMSTEILKNSNRGSISSVETA